MKRNKWSFFCLFVILCGVWVGCSDDRHSGGVTDIGNSIAGRVFLADGNSPAASARVVAYADSWNGLGVTDTFLAKTRLFRDRLRRSRKVLCALSARISCRLWTRMGTSLLKPCRMEIFRLCICSMESRRPILNFRRLISIREKCAFRSWNFRTQKIP